MQLAKIKLVTFVIFFSSLLATAQESSPEKENIANILENYFYLDRENIHLHLNKSHYLSNEQVWFSGYVFHRKKNTPFFATTNVYAHLFDDSGNKIADQLLFADNGSFDGKFKLGEDFKSGKYYIQVFTNWMNNFQEDESSTFEINVINTKEQQISDAQKPNYSKINVDFFPEGGSIISNAENSVGIKISDCNGNPLSLTEVTLMDEENKPTQNIALNKFGLGKFQYFATKKGKITFKIDGKTIEKTLPESQETGLSFDVNNFAIKDKTIVKIRTNKNSLDYFKGRKLFLLIHQDNKYNILDFNYLNNNLEQAITFSNELLFDGVNTLRIIDTEKNQFSERHIFKYPKNDSNLSIQNKLRKNDSISIATSTNLSKGHFSVSVLPIESLSSTKHHTIFSSFYINPYVNTRKFDAQYYFEDISKAKQYALDLFLLNQNLGKQKWHNIIGTPPKEKFTFDFGISVKGTANQDLRDRSKFKAKLYSINADINETSSINEKNEFVFPNLILADSTFVNFSLLDQNNKTIPLNLYAKISDGRKKFNKPFTNEKAECGVDAKINFELPEFPSGSITINPVDISVTQKPKLKNATLDNTSLRAYKVDENDNSDVLNYLRTNGFSVHLHIFENTVHIYGRSISKISADEKVPILYIDGMQQTDFDILANMRMSHIDEIYSNASVTPAAGINNRGIIKIYTRPDSKYISKKNDSRSYEIKNAFSKVAKFKNSTYASTENKGFQNFGTIHWIPKIQSENGQFSFKFPDMNQKKVLILIEGFSADGKLISEIKTIELE